MKVDGHHYRSGWLTEDGLSVAVVDQTKLPFYFEIRTLRTCDEVVLAIKDMVVRGAPLIGASAACGLRLATLEDPSDDYLQAQALALIAARPTAINLRWAVDRVCSRLLQANPKQRADLALKVLTEKQSLSNTGERKAVRTRLTCLHTATLVGWLPSTGVPP